MPPPFRFPPFRFSRRALAAGLVVAFGLPAAHAQTPAPPASDAALEALYWQRKEAARQRFTEADVAFMTGMIGHHAQALVMSELAPTNGARRSVRTLAARILNAQRDEIETMQRWLRDRGRPVPLVDAEGRTTMPAGVADPHAGHAMPAEAGHDDATHARHVADGTHARHQADGTHAEHHAGDSAERGHDGHDMSGHAPSGHEAADGRAAVSHAGMPGMLSEAQLDELRAARGTAFDRLFLRYMIQHHGGAIVMVDELIAHDGAVQDEAAFKLAADVRVDQATEIARMQLMLDALPADSQP